MHTKSTEWESVLPVASKNIYYWKFDFQKQSEFIENSHHIQESFHSYERAKADE